MEIQTFDLLRRMIEKVIPRDLNGQIVQLKHSHNAN
jgi:hypothetical protein